MKRINVRYGATDYSIGGRDLAEVQQEIADGLAKNQVYWLQVNEGSGREQPASLAISLGTPIALTPIIPR
jgi:hypothetical protein